MKFLHLAYVLLPASHILAQTFAPYTDDNGIEFWQGTFDTEVEGTQGKAQWGMALPPASASDLETEYIGRFVVPKLKSSDTWMGLSHNSGMTGALLLVTWPNGDTVESSFRYASGYVAPDIYTGNATLSVISQGSNSTHYFLTYRCENCWKWEQDGSSGSQIPATTASAGQVVGWAQATNGPSNPKNANSNIQQHANDGLFGAAVESARNSAYTKWTSLATGTTSSPAGSGTASTSGAPSSTVAPSSSSGAEPTSTACPKSNPATEQTWDYIVVGAGAGGIPLADKLSETGASVLLIERGPPSSGRWGGTKKPDWLVGTNLTRFDVPGLDNEIWVDSAGIACPDVGVMSGCVLGGGTAINAGLWWRANPEDFDYNFPDGWKSSNMEAAVARTFERIPFTDRPSTDGILYKPEGYNIVAGALAAAGWDNVTADDEPAKKNFTFSHPDEMFSHGERGGPMATYLVTASQRDNFQLVTNTTVSRLVRNGGNIAGVEIEAFLKGGQCGTVRVKDGGKVILSAGAFNTPKILFRSGIGPQDQLQVVQKAEPKQMIGSSQWIDLPVGYNLDDHVNTDIVITHPNVSFYDFYAAYNNPIKADAKAYLDSRTGILTQSAPNLAVVFWQEIEGDDGITRQLQWTARVEGGHGITSKKAMTISQYLGRGATSRGRTTINSGLNMVVSTVPYLHNKYDIAAVQSGIEILFKSLAKDPKIKVVYPAANTSIASFLSSYPTTTRQDIQALDL
jgi:cellobiose dehydrogenase (acceptor)